MTTQTSTFAAPDSSTTSTGRITRHLPTAARVVLGLAFFVFGLDGFLHFIPPPPPEALPAGAAAFGGAMMKTGYMFPLVKGTELVAGLLLLSNRFVPLALVVLAPALVNIVAFHAFLAPGGSGPAVVAVALEVYLAWVYREVFRPLLAVGGARG